MKQAGRADGHFRAADDRPQVSKRYEDARVADYIVVQKVDCAGVEAVHIERPPAERYAHPDIVLNIPLSMQRNEAVALRDRELQHRTGEAVERRRLVVIRVVTVQGPMQPWNADRHAQPRVGGVLIHQTAIMRKPHAEVQREPGGRLELDRKSTRLNSSHLGISYA